MQTRSKLTVEALVEAAARVFSAAGFEGATTNAIAELAGVSVGSLYQYFPDKLALLDAVHQRHIIGLWQVAGDACQAACAKPWPEAVRHFVAATNEYNLGTGRLFGLFQRELPPSIPASPAIGAAKSAYEAKLRAFLVAHQANLRVEVERAVYMIPIIGKGVVTTAFHAHPEDLGRGRLIDEVTKVLVHYLSGQDPTGARRPMQPILPLE